MSVVPNQIIVYGSANMPEADSVTVGGNIDFTKRVMFADLPFQGLSGSANSDTLDIVSGTSGDTGVHVQVTGRDGAGVIQTPAFVTFTGTTVLASTFGGQLFQRLNAGVITGGAINTLTNPGGTAAVSDCAVLRHTRILSGRTAQVGSANTTGTTPPIFKLQAGDGATVAAAVYAGLGVIIRITGGTGTNQLRMISAQYAAGTAGYGTDIVAVNKDWVNIPDATSTYDLAYGFLFDITPNPVTAITRAFATSAADVPGGSQRIYYEKCFAVNVNGSISLTGATIQVFSESGLLPGGALLDLALDTALNGSSTAPNRQTAPSGTAVGTFTTQPSAISVVGGNLNFGNSAPGAQGMWLRLTLPAGTATYQGAADLRVNGNTT